MMAVLLLGNSHSLRPDCIICCFPTLPAAGPAAGPAGQGDVLDNTAGEQAAGGAAVIPPAADDSLAALATMQDVSETELLERAGVLFSVVLMAHYSTMRAARRVCILVLNVYATFSRLCSIAIGSSQALGQQVKDAQEELQRCREIAEPMKAEARGTAADAQHAAEQLRSMAKREQQRGLPSRPVARKLQLLASGAQRGAVWVSEQAHLVGELADAVQAARLQLEPSANLTAGTIRQASGAAWGGVAAFFEISSPFTSNGRSKQSHVPGMDPLVGSSLVGLAVPICSSGRNCVRSRLTLQAVQSAAQQAQLGHSPAMQLGQLPLTKDTVLEGRLQELLESDYEHLADEGQLAVLMGAAL